MPEACAIRRVVVRSQPSLANSFLAARIILSRVSVFASAVMRIADTQVK